MKRIISLILVMTMMSAALTGLVTPVDAVVAGAYDERGAALAGRDVHLAWLCVKRRNLVDHYAREFVDSAMWNSYYLSTDNDQMSKIYAYRFLTFNLGDLTDYSEEELFYELLLYNNLISSDITVNGSQNMVDDYYLQDLLALNKSYEAAKGEVLDANMDAADLLENTEYLQDLKGFEIPDAVGTVADHADIVGTAWETVTDMIRYAGYLDAVQNVSEYNRKVMARLLKKSTIKGTWSITLDQKPMYIDYDEQLRNAISSVISTMEVPAYGEVLTDVAADHLLPEILEETAEKVVEQIFKKVMLTTSPKLAALRGITGTAGAVMWARDAGRLGANILTGADAYLDSSFILINLARMEMMMALVLDDVRNNFINDASEENAKELNAAYKMMLNLKYSTYEYAEDYLESVYKKGIWKKVCGFFSGIFQDNRYNDNYDNTIENLHSERDRLKSIIDSYEADASERYRKIINAELSAGRECEVLYDANGGTGAPAAQYKGKTDTLTISSAIPVRAGHTFKGWATGAGSSAVSYKPGDKYSGSSSLILYAVWNQNTFTIQYDACGGSGAPAAQTKYGGTPIYLSSKIPVREGYAFCGWATTPNASAAVYQAGGKLLSDKSLYLYAVWKKSTFTITYDASYGTGAPQPQTKNAGDIITLSTQIPTKGIYQFGGWAVAEALTKAAFQPGDNYSADADLYLYAIWNQPSNNPAPVIPETYTVSYNANGGSGVPSPQTKTEGIPLKLSSEKPSRSGYVFAGWKLETSNPENTNGTVIVCLMPGDMFTYDTDAVLTAQWGLPTHTPIPTEKEEFSYDVISGKVRINAYNGSDANVVVPETINGYDVAYISSSVFANKSFIRSVSLPDTIVDIGSSAFIGCSGLTEIDLPDNLEMIGTGTFNMCDGLEEIVIPASVKRIEYGAFSYCTNLSSVFFEGDAPAVEKNAFERCADDLILYYYLSSDGWTTPEWTDSAGYNTYHTIRIDDSSRILVSGSCGNNIVWSLNGGGTLMISGSGAMTDYSTVSNIPWSDYQKDITAIVVGEGVTGIGKNAFYSCINASSLLLPGSLTTIKAGAFEKCRSLESITIPAKVSSIGSDAFAGCRNLKEIKADSGNTVFSTDSYGVLYDNKNNELVAFPAQSSLTFYQVREGCKRIASHAFAECEKLTQVILPDSLTWIKGYAFSDCYGLKKMIIPAATTTISVRAFDCCENLTDVYFEGNVPTFETYVFDDCSADLKLHYYAGSIGWSTPQWTDKHGVTFRTVKIGEGPDGVVGGTYGNTTWILDTEGCLKLYGEGKMQCYITAQETTVWEAYKEDIVRCIIYEGVTTVEKYAFAGCENLVSVQIPSTVTSLKNDAFSGCSSLKEISLPEEVTQIPARCFKGCEALESIVLPAGVTRINNNAFNGCTNLKNVIFMGDAPELVSMGSFDGCPDEMTFYYLPESANWSTPVWMYLDTDAYAAKPLYAAASLPGEGFMISGTITSDGSPDEHVTVALYDADNNLVDSDESDTYSLFVPAAGTYTLKVSKKNHVTRIYTVIVED